MHVGQRDEDHVGAAALPLMPVWLEFMWSCFRQKVDFRHFLDHFKTRFFYSQNLTEKSFHNTALISA